MTTARRNKLVREAIFCGGLFLWAQFPLLAFLSMGALFIGHFEEFASYVAAVFLIVVSVGLSWLAVVMIRLQESDLPQTSDEWKVLWLRLTGTRTEGAKFPRTRAEWKAIWVRFGWKIVGWYIVFVGLLAALIQPFAVYNGSTPLGHAIGGVPIYLAVAYGGYKLAKKQKQKNEEHDQQSGVS